MSYTSNMSYVKIALITVAAIALFFPSNAAVAVGEACDDAILCASGLRCATDGKCIGGSGAPLGGRCGGTLRAPIVCAQGLACEEGLCVRSAPLEEVGGPPAVPTEGIIIPCALQKPGEGYCSDVNDLLLQLIQIGKEAFKYIGALAFFFFIYGGLTIILSMGSAEKAKKGHQILVAAVIGLLIAFSAYILIDFVLDALGVTAEFRGVQ